MLKKIILKNGTCLFNHFGKYCPNLTILTPHTDAEDYEEFKIDEAKYDELAEELNIIYSGEIWAIFKGSYFISKKGNKCFRITPKGSQYFIGIKWGGSYNNNTGLLFDLQEKPLYFRKAASGGRGEGYDYIITNKDGIRIEEEDLEKFEIWDDGLYKMKLADGRNVFYHYGDATARSMIITPKTDAYSYIAFQNREIDKEKLLNRYGIKYSGDIIVVEVSYYRKNHRYLEVGKETTHYLLYMSSHVRLNQYGFRTLKEVEDLEAGKVAGVEVLSHYSDSRRDNTYLLIKK